MSSRGIPRRDGEMEFRILGPIEVRDRDRVVTPAAARQRALLGILLLHAGEAVPTGALVDAVWGDAPPQRPAAALRALVEGLRRALEPGRAPGAESILVAEDAGIRLRAQLMLALHRCGRHWTALAACASARHRLEPGPELQSLERAIRDRDPELDGPATRSSLTVVGMPVAADPPPPVEAAEEDVEEVTATVEPSPAVAAAAVR